jgi:predicted ester cyclase
MTAQDVAERTNAEVVRGYFDLVWNRGDLAGVERFFGDEFANFGHQGPDARALIVQIVTTWRTALPDLRFEIEDEVVPGDAVVHLITCTGTHEGTFEHPATGMLPATGRSFTVDHCTSIECAAVRSSSTGGPVPIWRCCSNSECRSPQARKPPLRHPRDSSIQPGSKASARQPSKPEPGVSFPTRDCCNRLKSRHSGTLVASRPETRRPRRRSRSSLQAERHRHRCTLGTNRAAANHLRSGRRETACRDRR